MTVKGLLFRFFVAYLGLLIIAGLTLSYFAIKGNSGINTGILFGLVYGVCTWFGHKNKRYFTKDEKIVTVIGLIVIDVFVQLLLILITLSANHSAIDYGIVGFAISFSTALHALIIYFVVGSCKKHLIQQKVISIN